MEIQVTEDMMNSRKAVDVRIEEIADISFDLSETGDYVDIGDISGRLIIEYEVNHGKIRDQLERAWNPGVRDRVNAFFEEWSLEMTDTRTLDIDYGSLLMRGTEPIPGVDEQIPLGASISAEKFQQTSPDDLKRDLRQEQEYSVSYADIEADIESYLEREGINTEQVSLGSPVHIQATAEPIADDDVCLECGTVTAQPGEETPNRCPKCEGREISDLYGTEFTISVENQAPRPLDESSLRVDMEPQIGRNIVTLGSTSGSYDPEREVLELRVPSVEPARGSSPKTQELTFVVPHSTGADLEEFAGEAVLNTTQPFTNYMPVAVFDPGGHMIYERSGNIDSAYADVRTTCSIQAEFETPTADIMVGETATVEKKISMEGVTPIQAEEKIESILRQRDIDTSGGVNKTSTEMREQAEVANFSGTFSGGSVIVEDTRINIELDVKGERRTGEAGAERSGGEELPAKQRNVSIDYGRTGVTIRGRGADAEKVDRYVSDLRDELRLGLESVAEEV